MPDAEDAFPLNSTESIDTDGDGTGNNADADDDNDGVLDGVDAFPLISLGALTDTDGDGRPNDCDAACQSLGMSADPDDDNDGVLDGADAFPLISLQGRTDTDGDGRPNDCDATCQASGMAADLDDDNDGLPDTADAFPLASLGGRTDTDNDGRPDSCDLSCQAAGMSADIDDDNDGVLDDNDAFPLISLNGLTDTDGDGRPNECNSVCESSGMFADLDDDNDGVPDSSDAFPLISLGSLTDTDGDGRPNDCDTSCQAIGMSADLDDDNDGVEDSVDAFPTDPSETLDTDGDGVGNNADDDDDGDGVSDEADAYPLNPDVHTAPTTATQSLSLDLLPQATNTLSGILTATSQDGRPVTFSIVSNGDTGTAVITDQSSGAFTYSTTTTALGIDSFTYKVNDGFVDSEASRITVQLNSDPLYKYQWHLENTGQTNFATAVGIPGQDLNLKSALSSGLTGEGVIVAVVDDGLEIAHEDLSENIVPGGSFDFIGGDTDPTESSNDGGHGTAVAGIIAAKGWNNTGVRGVAPNSSLKGFNFLSSDQDSSKFLEAFGGQDYSQDVDIFNYSAGSYLRSFSLLQSIRQQAVTSIVPSLRDGKGAVWIKSAGNGFDGNRKLDPIIDQLQYLAFCGNFSGSKLSCNDAITDPLHIWPQITVVGALDAYGKKASYSSPSAAIWVSGYGGEYGYNSDVASASGETLTPAIMTVDKSGCSRGYVSDDENSQPFNAFNLDSPPHPENQNCNYTSTFNGTSSAAPTVTGVVSLMLEKNPELTYRDVKHILASTARKVDPDFLPVALDGITYYQWVENSAGFNFHNWFGFGAVNTDAAIAMASTYTAGSLGAQRISAWDDTQRDSTIAQISEGVNTFDTLTSSTNGIIEYVRIRIPFSSAIANSVGFRLQSPSGTMSTILQPHTNINVNPFFEVVYLASSAFYGEPANGEWKLWIYDHDIDGFNVFLGNWGLKFFYRQED